MKWFLINNFFIHYNFELLDKNHKDRQKQKRLHYKENLMQMIKNLIIVDTLFIDKIFEDSKIKGDSPQANYGFLLKNSNFSNLNYQIKQDDENDLEPDILSYPLKNIEEFILLLKITNVDRIKDYICFYTLLDLGYTEDSQALQDLISENKSESNFKEILFYWRLETSFVHSGLSEHIPSDIQNVDKIPYQWIASVLQTLLELKKHDVTVATLSAKSDGFDDPRIQKSFELMVYLQCELGKYNQAFMTLLSIEDKVNNIRYKNIYQMFLSHILMNKNFELLCSYHLSERQEELTKDFLQSSESDLNQLYYLSFLASRGTTLEGLKYAKAFFDKLKSESEDKSRFGAEQASMMAEIVAYLIKSYSHVLPPIHKKFAFDYLKLESGKFHLAINAKKLKEKRIKAERKDSMDVDNDASSQWFSDQGKYSPFINDKVSKIMDTRIPKTFEDPYRVSVRKNDLSGKKSMIKNFQSIKKNEDSTLANIFDAVRIKTPKPEPNFLTIQKHDNIIAESDEDIAYDEEDDDIASGKKTNSKFMKGLKDRANAIKEFSKPMARPLKSMEKEPKKPLNEFYQKPSSDLSQKPSSDLSQKPSYPDIDYLGLEKFKPKPFQSSLFKSSPVAQDKSMSIPITKESLLAGLPPSLRNSQQNEQKSPKEEIKDDLKSEEQDASEEQDVSEVDESPEPESLMIQNKNARQAPRDVNMESESDSHQSSSKKSDIYMPIRVQPVKRRRSFELKPGVFHHPLHIASDQEMELLQDPNTGRFDQSAQKLPNFSKANDDIEFERRKRAAKHRRVMGFLYAGDLPGTTSPNRVESSCQDLDQTPNKLSISSNIKPKEEEKDSYEVVNEVQSKSFEYLSSNKDDQNNIQSEVVYDMNNPLIARISNRSNNDTVKTDKMEVKYDDRQTEGANILEKLKRIVEAEPMPPLDQELDIIHETISERSLSRSVISSVVMSSDQSVAAPPLSEGESEPDVVFQAVSSKSGEEGNNSDINEPNSNFSPIKTRAQLRNQKISQTKYKGKNKFKKTGR